MILLLALGWGIYRDLTHFHHLFIDAQGDPALEEEIDDVAGSILVLGALKTAYHGIRALRVLTRLTGARRSAD